MAASTQTASPSGRVGRFVGFALVGASGLAVNQIALWALTEKVGIYYLLSAILATQVSTVWNFALVERWVFVGGTEGRLRRFGLFALMNNLWLLLRTPFLFLLTDVVGINYLLSNMLVLGAMTLVRFGIADRVIWADRGGDGVTVPGSWAYDIHGIVGIVSETPLPELARFEVPLLLDQPDIEVTVSNKGFGGLRRRVLVREDRGIVTYVEHLGRFGFAAKIDVDSLARIQVSKLLKRSPHVAYTNVVEPVVRWTLVHKGYILAHAACLQIDGHGVLITARTDTGKTTTCLKSIKEQGSGFLSDDMVIIDPSGWAMSYPKPLTISSHTLHAVKGAPLALRTRAWLQIQGRIHSRFGRSVGLAIGNVNLPVATMSALVQMIVPPPKFHVDELIPGTELVSSLELDRLVVIERGEALARELDTISSYDTLSANTEDAYGFPPYPRIGHALAKGRSDREQEIRRLVVDGLDAVLLRTPDRAWFELLPQLAAGIGVEPDTEVVRVDEDGEVMLDLTGVGSADPEAGAVIQMDMSQVAETIATRFARLSPEEADEVEHALTGALALLQKVSDILDGESEREEPAVSGLVASVRSLRDARISQGKG
jgi:dolichol-phosphate mannosyltransferase